MNTSCCLFRIDEFIKHPTGLPLLLQTYQPFDVVSEAIELAYCRACGESLDASVAMRMMLIDPIKQMRTVFARFSALRVEQMTLNAT